MKYEKVEKLFVCCGQYIAPTASASKKKIKCPRCDKELTNTIKLPVVVIVKN